MNSHRANSAAQFSLPAAWRSSAIPSQNALWPSYVRGCSILFLALPRWEVTVLVACESKAQRCDEAGISEVRSGTVGYSAIRLSLRDAGRTAHLWRLAEVEVDRWVCAGGGFTVNVVQQARNVWNCLKSQNRACQHSLEILLQPFEHVWAFMLSLVVNCRK